MLQALNTEDLPTPKAETWKYTNLPRVVPENLTHAEPQEIVIHKSSGEVCEQIEDILFTGEAGKLHTPHLKIILEEGAQLTLVECHDGKGHYWKNMVTEIELGANARLNHVRFQEDNIEGVNTNVVQVRLARDSVYDGFSLNTGGKLSRHEIYVLIEGENAEFNFRAINLLKGSQHGDTTIVIKHNAPYCRSNQFIRTLLDDQARGVFQGKVHVDRAAQKTDAYQLSNAILLSQGAEMDTKPELEIYADDVKCSHGATTGQLDEEPLFYLRSRGLSESEARQLLVQAFVDEVADKIVDEDLQSRVKEKSQLWLQSVL